MKERLGHVSFEHTKPDITFERVDHTVKMFEDGVDVGEISMNYRSRPFPHYYISDIGVDYELQGAGRGTILLRYLQKFLERSGKAGYLHSMDTNRVRRFYEKNGWIPVPGERNGYVYNLPKGVDISEISTAHKRYQPMFARNREEDFENDAS